MTGRWMVFQTRDRDGVGDVWFAVAYARPEIWHMRLSQADAMDYANQQLRAERRQQAARAMHIEVRPGATPSATDVRAVFRCPACMSKEA